MIIDDYDDGNDNKCKLLALDLIYIFIHLYWE